MHSCITQQTGLQKCQLERDSDSYGSSLAGVHYQRQYEVEIKMTMKYSWKYLWFIPRILKSHGFWTHKTMKLPWKSDVEMHFMANETTPWYTMNWLSWYVSLGWFNISWKHHRCFMAYLSDSECDLTSDVYNKCSVYGVSLWNVR